MSARTTQQRDADPIAVARLRNQRLAGKPYRDAADVVAWLGAVQAQDYAGAKWALAQRTRASTEAEVEHALDAGAILRTHALRPTWHFVAPADIRWLLMLTAARVRAALAYYDRKLDIDSKLLRRSRLVLEKALGGGVQLTRSELGSRLRAAGIVAQGQRLGHLMMHAEQDALICSGARRGKQSTYALIDERAPAAKALSDDEALYELSLRYFASRGPASAADFSWWSGLSVRDARRGIDLAAAKLVKHSIDGNVYWQAPSKTKPRAEPATIHLLPNYDEYLVAYKDRSAAFDPRLRITASATREGVFANQVIRNGRIIGAWQRTLEPRKVLVETRLRVRLDATEQAALRAAVERFGRFLRLPARLEVR